MQINNKTLAMLTKEMEYNETYDETIQRLIRINRMIKEVENGKTNKHATS